MFDDLANCVAVEKVGRDPFRRVVNDILMDLYEDVALYLKGASVIEGAYWIALQQRLEDCDETLSPVGDTSRMPDMAVAGIGADRGAPVALYDSFELEAKRVFLFRRHGGSLVSTIEGAPPGALFGCGCH
ncbi:MAG: hypothetical protein NXH97_20290 [Rhodobacteraceae bacterium]|nr:hypothetical protein [Paracoccaceae bacterium]